MTTPGSDPSAYGDSGSGSMPPPPAYETTPGYPGQGGPMMGGPMAAPRNGFGIAALVLGILAIVLCWTVYGGIILGILAIIFAVLGMRRAKRGEATNRGMAISGLVTGIIGLVIAVVLIAIGGVFLSIFGSSVNNYQSCMKQAGSDQGAQTQCMQQYQNDIQNKIGGNGNNNGG